MKLDLLTGLYVFMLAAFIGFEVIRRVSPLLHTPLMSLTNALDAIAVVGAIILAGEHKTNLAAILGTIAIIAATSNIVGGFIITVLVHTDMASPHLVRFGTKRQLEKYLPGVLTGEIITAVGVTEPGAGSDVAGIRTRAVRDGNDYVLNGTKMFITNGVYGDLYFLAARTDPEAKGSRAITMFIIEKGTPGFKVGRALDKTGWRSSDTAELIFEDCRIPAENVLGEPNRGFYSIMANFQTERLVIGAMAMAEAREALRLTFEHVSQRTAFGQPLWDKQAIRQRLSRRLAEVEAARQLVHHTAWLDAQGGDCVAQVSMVKALAGDLVNQVLYDCVQFHGGMGFVRETAVEPVAGTPDGDDVAGIGWVVLDLLAHPADVDRDGAAVAVTSP